MKRCFVVVDVLVSGLDDFNEIATYMAGLFNHLGPEDKLNDLCVYEIESSNQYRIEIINVDTGKTVYRVPYKKAKKQLFP